MERDTLLKNKEIWYCSECHRENSISYRHCTECGAQKPDIMFERWICSDCGARNLRTNSFCYECGNSKVPVVSQPPLQPTPDTQITQKPMVEPFKPASKPQKPTVEPYKPVSKPQKPTVEPYKPAAQPQKPAVEPYKPAAKLHKPMAKPSNPVSRPQKPLVKPNKSATESKKPSADLHKPIPTSQKPIKKILAAVAAVIIVIGIGISFMSGGGTDSSSKDSKPKNDIVASEPKNDIVASEKNYKEALDAKNNKLAQTQDVQFLTSNVVKKDDSHILVTGKFYNGKEKKLSRILNSNIKIVLKSGDKTVDTVSYDKFPLNLTKVDIPLGEMGQEVTIELSGNFADVNFDNFDVVFSNIEYKYYKL